MSPRVLLADDHAIVRDGLRMMLERDPDVRVVGESGTGRDAVLKAKTLKPDVAILDIAMPELNGIEAAEQIHRAEPGIGIIILSMYSTREHVVRAIRAGASGYVLKESAVVEIVDAVREVGCGRRYLSDKVPEAISADCDRVDDTSRLDTPIERLSSRERQILQLVAEGKTSAEIASMLFLSPKTVDTYRSRLMKKLGVGDIAALVRFAIQHGVISVD